MANNHTKQRVTCDGHTKHLLSGYFHGTIATTVLSVVKGTGFSVTRTDTGVYTICLSATYPSLIGLAFSPLLSVTLPATPSLISSSTVSATNTIKVFVSSVTTSGSTAIDLGTGIGLSFVGIFNNSSLTT